MQRSGTKNTLLSPEMSSANSPTVDPRVFYKSSPSSSKYASVDGSSLPPDVEIPRWLRSLSEGPTNLWRVFKKQNEALNFSKQHGEGLMTFACQEKDGTRRFLSAHPVFFWFYDNNHKLPQDRCTFEVITEGAACKLYFDLEFEKEFNKDHCGVQMTDTFIKIVSQFLKEEFSVSCDRRNVLDFDSTTNSKFSRHLVFQLPKTYFRDNYNVGNFVRMICDKLRLVILSESALHDLCTKCGLSEEDVLGLFVADKHGVSKTFCDEAVYTKNRHFRLYKSTKWKKNSPLLLSEENQYQPVLLGKERLAEKQLFLDSLITYVGETHQDLNILEYGSQQKIYVVKSVSKLPDCPVVSEGVKSPYPVVDRFVQRLVCPGVIRRSVYSSSHNRIVYEISGNRFCYNIGRHHKSNNVYYVLDLSNFQYYQKCHDPDCSGYQSKQERLPPEIIFMLENEGDALFESFSVISDQELFDIWNAVTSAAEIELEETAGQDDSLEIFPEFGMSDTELLNSTLELEGNDL